jgi:hypothetical protein
MLKGRPPDEIVLIFYLIGGLITGTISWFILKRRRYASLKGFFSIVLAIVGLGLIAFIVVLFVFMLTCMAFYAMKNYPK